MKKKKLALLAGVGLTFTLASCNEKPEDVWRGDLDDLSIVNLDINVGSAATNTKQSEGVTSYVGEFVTNSSSRELGISTSHTNVLKVRNSSGHIGFYSLNEQKYIVQPIYAEGYIETATVFTTTNSVTGEILNVRENGTTHVYDIYGSVLYEGKGTLLKTEGKMVNNKAYITLFINYDGDTTKKYFEYSEANTPKEVEAVPISTKTEAETVNYIETKFGDTYSTTSKYDLTQFGIKGYVLKSSTTYTIFENDTEKATIKLPKNSTGYYIGKYLYYQDSELKGDDISVDTYKVDLETGEVSQVKKFGYKIASATLYKDDKGVENYVVAQLYKVYKNHVSNDAEVYILDSDLTLHDSLNGLVNFYPDSFTKIGDNYYDSSTHIIYDHEFNPVSYLSDLTVNINPEYDLLIVNKTVDGITYYGAVDYNGKVVIPLEYRSLVPLEGASYSYAIDAQEGCIIAKKIDADGNNQFYRVNYKTGEATYLGKDVSCLVDDLYWTTTNTETENSISFMSQAKTLTTVKATHGGVLSLENYQKDSMTLNDTSYYHVRVVETYVDEYNSVQYEYHRLTFALNKSKTPFKENGTEITTEEDFGKNIKEALELKVGDNKFTAHTSTNYTKFKAPEDGYYLFTGYDDSYIASAYTNYAKGLSVTNMTVEEGNAKYVYVEKDQEIYLTTYFSSSTRKININVSKLDDGVTKSNYKEMEIGETYTVPSTYSGVTYYTVTIPYDAKNTTAPVRITTNTKYATVNFYTGTNYNSTKNMTAQYDKNYDKFYQLNTGATCYFTVTVNDEYEGDVTLTVENVDRSLFKEEGIKTYDPSGVIAAPALKLNEYTKVAHLENEKEAVTYTNETEETQYLYFNTYYIKDDNEKALAYTTVSYLIKEDESVQSLSGSVFVVKPGETVVGYIDSYSADNDYYVTVVPVQSLGEGNKFNTHKNYRDIITYKNTTDKPILIKSVKGTYKDSDDVTQEVNLGIMYALNSENKLAFLSDYSGVVYLAPGESVIIDVYGNVEVNDVELVINTKDLEEIPTEKVTFTNENSDSTLDKYYIYVIPENGCYQIDEKKTADGVVSYPAKYKLSGNRIIQATFDSTRGCYFNKGDILIYRHYISSANDEYSLELEVECAKLEKTGEVNTDVVKNFKSDDFYTVTKAKDYYGQILVKGTVIAAEKDASDNMTITISDGHTEFKVNSLYSFDRTEYYVDGYNIVEKESSTTATLDQVATLPTVGSYIYLYGYSNGSVMTAATIITNPDETPAKAIRYSKVEIDYDVRATNIYSDSDISWSVFGIPSSYINTWVNQNDAASLPTSKTIDTHVEFTLYKSATEDGKGNSVIFHNASTYGYYDTVTLTLKEGSKAPTIIVDGKTVTPVDGVYTIKSDNFTILNDTDEDIVILGIKSDAYTYNGNQNTFTEVYDVAVPGIVNIEFDYKENGNTESSTYFTIFYNGVLKNYSSSNTTEKTYFSFFADKPGQVLIYYSANTYMDNESLYSHDYSITTNVNITNQGELPLNTETEYTIEMDQNTVKKTYEYEATEDGCLSVSFDTKYPKTSSIMYYTVNNGSYTSSNNNAEINLNVKKGQKYLIVTSMRSEYEDEDVDLKYKLVTRFTPNTVTLDDNGKATVEEVYNGSLYYTAGEADEIIKVSSKSYLSCEVGESPSGSSGTTLYVVVPAGETLKITPNRDGYDINFEKLESFTAKATTSKDTFVINPLSETGYYDVYFTVDKNSLDGKIIYSCTQLGFDTNSKSSSTTLNLKNYTYVENADGTYTLKLSLTFNKKAPYVFEVETKDATLVSVEIKR